MAGMVVGAIAMGYAASGLYAGLQPMAQAAASGATASFSTTYITTGDFDDSLQAGVIGGLSAGITYGVAHGATGGTSPFGAALPLAHGVVQGGFHELQGGSFKQGFISGVIGKLGGGIVHANVQTQTLQAGGMIIVSGIAAAASGANSRDAVMRSAVSVITVYLYNEMGKAYIFDQDRKGNWHAVTDNKRDSVNRSHPQTAEGILAKAAGEDSILDHETFDRGEQKNSLTGASVVISPLYAPIGLALGGVSTYMSYQDSGNTQDFTGFGLSAFSHVGGVIFPQAQPIWSTMDNFNSIITVTKLIGEE